MSLNLGNWQLDTVNGGMFRLDGGVMFGVVPQQIWKHVAMPDTKNRIQCANHCVLARDGRHTVLVDTGYGGKYALLDRKFYDMEPGEPLLEGLAQLGVTRRQWITSSSAICTLTMWAGAMCHDARQTTLRSPFPMPSMS